LKLILYNPISNKFYVSNKYELTGTFSLPNYSNVIRLNSRIFKFHKPDNCLLGKKRKIDRLYESIETLESLPEEKIENSNIIKEIENIYIFIEKAVNIEDLNLLIMIYIIFYHFLLIIFLIIFKCNNNCKNNNNTQIKGINNFCILL